MSYIYEAPSKARNLTLYIDGREFLLGILLLEPTFRLYMREKPTNTPIIHSVACAPRH
jgi:hypothetical protein